MSELQIYTEALKDEIRRRGLYEAFARRFDAMNEILDCLPEARRGAAYAVMSEILLLVTAANIERGTEQ